MRVSKKNGSALDMLNLDGLLAQAVEAKRREALTPEERAAEAKIAFERLVDASIRGCSDPAHKAVEDAAAQMVCGMFNLDVLPPTVAAAVINTLVNKAFHDMGTPGEGLKWLADEATITTALVVAGAVLRVRDLPALPADGGTGVYL